MLHRFRRVVFFTGAGMSAECGIPTYRGAGGTGRSTDGKSMRVRPPSIPTRKECGSFIKPNANWPRTALPTPATTKSQPGNNRGPTLRSSPRTSMVCTKPRVRRTCWSFTEACGASGAKRAECHRSTAKSQSQSFVTPVVVFGGQTWYGSATASTGETWPPHDTLYETATCWSWWEPAVLSTLQLSLLLKRDPLEPTSSKSTQRPPI